MNDEELKELGTLRSRYIALTQESAHRLDLYVSAHEIFDDIQSLSADTLREAIAWLEGNPST